MHIHPVEELIQKEGADDSAVFVFPSDIAATLWLEKALDITGKGTLPVRRFIAWDRFKEQAVQATVALKQPVSALLRKLYALELSSRNAKSEPPLFQSLIPAPFSGEGAIFASWLARLLPQLEMWEQKTKRENKYNRDAEDADLAYLKADYQSFLDRNRLFEPSWQRPPLVSDGNRYFIFFPEAIEDFAEYEAILSGAPFVTTVPVPAPECGPPALTVHENTRGELRAIALEIEELLRSGTKCGDIALSVSGLETVSPYLLRELSLRGIPFEFRAGEPLGTRPAGRLFSLIQNCVSANFSFASVKALLLDRLIPWKDRSRAEGLVGFGIRNHCVTSWKENGKLVDIWEEAFKAPSKGEEGDRDLRAWYRNLKSALTRMAGAESFSDIRKGYVMFRDAYLDSALYSPEDDAVVARCVAELNALASLEKFYPGYIPQGAYGFFTSVLDEKNYVAQRAHGGVSIYAYRVAAGTPYPHHFILDASQGETTVLYRRLPFLRQDKRATLNLSETDASAAFFSMYATAPRARFSFSSRSFAGYQTPHGWFREQIPAEMVSGKPIAIGDPFAQERRFLAGAETVFPDRLYPSQKDGYSAWKRKDVLRGFSYLREPYAARIPELTALVKKIQNDGEDLRVSQTDLGTFSICNARWFLGKILRIEAESSDAELMNERNLGLLYHDVLEKTYGKIRDTDGAFNAAHLEDYRAWAEEYAGSAASGHAEFRGPLAAPLIASLVGKIAEGVGGILEKDAELLDGFIPEFLEDDIAFSRDGIRYYGRIDRVSRRSADGTAVLIDYKSGRLPSASKYVPDAEKRIADFQIPMYVFLAEESPESPYRGSRIEHAWFGNIKEGDYQPIINDNETIKCGSKRGMMTRDEFAESMESFRSMTDFFASSVRKADFTRPDGLPWTECARCDFQKICRYTYAVRP